jgi:hypothetical protein
MTTSFQTRSFVDHGLGQNSLAATTPLKFGFITTLPDFPNFFSSFFSWQLPPSTPIADNDFSIASIATTLLSGSYMFQICMKCRWRIFSIIRTCACRVHIWVLDKGMGKICFQCGCVLASHGSAKILGAKSLPRQFPFHLITASRCAVSAVHGFAFSRTCSQ